MKNTRDYSFDHDPPQQLLGGIVMLCKGSRLVFFHETNHDLKSSWYKCSFYLNSGTTYLDASITFLTIYPTFYLH